MAGNKQIAKNTLFLYGRTAITMLITLYTSRVILEQLGVSDYGVYTVVGGFVAMLNAFAAPLGGATQRFVTYAIGTKDIKNIRKVFSTCVYIHLALAIITGLVIELIGYWYIGNKANIPYERIPIACLILHASVFTLLVRIITIPYTAATVAHEKFGFYAWNSIIQSILRLILIFLLPFCLYDKLIVYAIMETFVNCVLNLSFITFCLKKLYGCELVKATDKKLYKEIVSFSGWNFFGTSSNIIYTQGSSLLLNYFFGVVLNAALGVTNQVLSAITSFVSNFTLAVNPQITKSYASNDLERANNLVFFASDIAAYLLLIVGFPVVANVHYILGLWLVDVPEYTEIFVILALFASFVSSFSTSFNNLIFATGDIKRYQLMCVSINVSSIVVLFLLFYVDLEPYYIYIVLFMQYFIKQIFMINIVKIKTKFPARKYYLHVYLKDILFLAPIVLVIYLKSKIEYTINFGGFVVESILYVLCMITLIYLFGLSKQNRAKLLNIVKQKIKHED